MRLDWTERLTLALAVVFGVTLALTMWIADPMVWIVWGAMWVLLAGSALVAVNRGESSEDR